VSLERKREMHRPMVRRSESMTRNERMRQRECIAAVAVAIGVWAAALAAVLR
jgi:hypothetical protein